MIKVTETVTQFERSNAALSTANKNQISEKNTTNNPCLVAKKNKGKSINRVIFYYFGFPVDLRLIQRVKSSLTIYKFFLEGHF